MEPRLSAADVAYTIQRLMDPALHSPTGDSFRSGKGSGDARLDGENQISIQFPAPIVGLDKLFDQVAMLSGEVAQTRDGGAGSLLCRREQSRFVSAAETQSELLEAGCGGAALPYIDSIRIEIEQNRDIEALRFERGEIDFIDSLNAEYYDRLAARTPNMA